MTDRLPNDRQIQRFLQFLELVNKLEYKPSIGNIPRSQYTSPETRSGYNYGYMTSGENGAGEGEMT